VYRLLLLVIALIVYGSLYPWHFDFDSSGANPLWVLLHAWPGSIDRFVLRDAAINLLLYFPLAWPHSWRRPGAMDDWWRSMRRCSLPWGFPPAWKCFRFTTPARTCSLFDVLCNVSGAAAGAAAALVFRPELESLGTPRAATARPRALLLAACWASYQLYPFFPLLSHAKFARLRSSCWPKPLPFPRWKSGPAPPNGWAAALVLEALFGRLRPRWLLAAMACLPLRLFIAERSVTAGETLGAALALLFWSLLPERKRLARGRTSAGFRRGAARVEPLPFRGNAAPLFLDSLRRHLRFRPPVRHRRSASKGLRVRRPGLAVSHPGYFVCARRGSGGRLAGGPRSDPTISARQDSRNHRFGSNASHGLGAVAADEPREPASP